MEADFTRYYHTDLRAACWGPEPWSVRRLIVHVKALPMESALVRAIRGEAGLWSPEAEVMASVFDAVQVLSHYTLLANGAKPDKPVQYPRPGSTTKQEVVDNAGLANFLKG